MRLTRLTRPLVGAVLLLMLCATPAAAQEAPPSSAFRAIHLMELTDSEAETVQTALADFNSVLAKMGYADIRYRLYKVFGPQAGRYNYLWESVWPSGQIYQKVHDSAEWVSVAERNSALNALMKDELYNRFVEVAPLKRVRN